MADEIVAKAAEIRDGEMRGAVAGGRGVLLIKSKGKLFAIGAKCPHYGGPLPQGVLSQDRVLCPWHQACFNIVTKKLAEPPALDSVSHFDVRVEGGNVIVSVPDEPAGTRAKPARKDTGADARTFAIVGGGAAGNMAAETLRQEGFRGRIVVVTREKALPYDRPKLSKNYLESKEKGEPPTLRSAQFYADRDIEFLTGREVVELDPAKKKIAFKSAEPLKYDALLLATGGTPRRLSLPGADLANVFTLRSLDDGDRLIGAAQKASKAVVIGASFIGMETAASLTGRGLSVTVVAPDAAPFERTLGKEIGAMFRKLHEENGVVFKLGSQAEAFEGQGKVEKVVLKGGEKLEAGLVVVGVGVQPATGFLKGVALNKDGSVPADERLCAGKDFYVAGDIAEFPDARTGERVRIEHWRLAEQHGMAAARNMLGKTEVFNRVPFFWTNQFGVNLRYVGHARAWDEIIFQGDPAAREFIAYYVRNSTILAAAGVGNDTQMAALAELMRINRLPAPDELRKGTSDFVKRLR